MRQRERQTDRHRERQTDRDRHTETDRQRERDRQTHIVLAFALRQRLEEVCCVLIVGQTGQSGASKAAQRRDGTLQRGVQLHAELNRRREAGGEEAAGELEAFVLLVDGHCVRLLRLVPPALGLSHCAVVPRLRIAQCC